MIRIQEPKEFHLSTEWAITAMKAWEWTPKQLILHARLAKEDGCIFDEVKFLEALHAIEW
jgi:hypothetical protein